MSERSVPPAEGRRLPEAPPPPLPASFREDSWRSPDSSHAQGVVPYHPTVLHALSAAARYAGDVGITILPDVEPRGELLLTWEELDKEARRFAAGLAAQGVEAGDRVLLVLIHASEFLVAFFGTQYLGALSVPAYPPGGLRAEAGVRRLRHVANDAGTELCVTSKVLLPILGDLGRSSAVRRIETVAGMSEGRSPFGAICAGSEDPAFIQYTSGSTDRPKGVVLTHRNLMCNVHSIGQAVEVARGDRLVSWCPLYHDMGLIGGPFYAIYWQLPLILLSPMAFLRKPVRWLRAIHDYRATFSPAPNFGYALATKRVSEEEREGLDLSCWRGALNGAELVNPSTVESFVEAYAPHGFRESAMMPVYGLAEATLAVTFAPIGTGARFETLDREALPGGRAVPAPDGLTVTSVGRPIPGQQVRILDAVGHPLPDRRIGFVQVTGPSIMKGYHGDPAATEHARDASWLWTGDLGYLADGELFLTGRANDVIILRGRNYHAEDLERSAEAVAGVRGGSAVAFIVYDQEEARERVVLVCETSLQDEAKRMALNGEIRMRVQEDTTVPVDDVLVVDPGTVPKGSSGKRQRSRCRDLYLEGRLQPPSPRRLHALGFLLRASLGLVRMWTRKILGSGTR